MKIIYVTGNEFKLKTAKNYLNPIGINVENIKIDCPEIQSDSIEDVAKYSSKYASDYLKCNVLKNDSGFVIPALNGFPSTYSKYVESVLGEDGILKLMDGIKNRKAYLIEVLAYTKHGDEPVTFISKTEGRIAKVKSGDNGYGYDKIFIPKGKSKTLANLTEDEKIKVFDSKAYLELAKYLNGN